MGVNRRQKLRQPRLQQLGLIVVSVLWALGLTACGIRPVTAQERTFLNLSLEFVGAYNLPKLEYQDTPVGALSGITYDRQRKVFYAISDDRSRLAPARFYTLKFNFNDQGIEEITVENVTFLKDQNGKLFPPNSIDGEGIAITPQNSVFISSEGSVSQGFAPFIREFDLTTGIERQALPIPERFIPDTADNTQTKGIQNNLGFEALTLSPTGYLPAKGEPFRLFSATEASLLQDQDPESSQLGAKSRFLHYLLSDGPPLFIAEYLYLNDPPASGALKEGLPEILALDNAGHFLTLERSLTLLGYKVKIYQAATGGATDTSPIASLKGESLRLEPIKKKLLVNFDDLSIPVTNSEGMTLGPKLPDGSQSLIVMSDDNFDDNQVTQFLLFRLKSS